MEYLRPKKLIPGQSVVGLIAPSGVVERHGLEEGIEILKSWGFSVKLGKHIRTRRADYSAGTASERAEDFLEMLVSNEVSAVGCIVGGFAATSLVKVLEPAKFDILGENPKIFFGYSDFSFILNVLFSKGFIALHAPNVLGLYLRSLTSQKSLKLSLLGDLPSEIGPLFDWEPIKPGFVRGRLLVSNFDSLVSLFGTPFDPLNTNDDEGLILALEEVGENKSTLARWVERLVMHSRAGRIRGIILGRFTKVGETVYPVWGREMSVERLFVRAFGQKKGFPIASLSEFGHVEEPRGFLRTVKAKAKEKTNFLSLPTGVRVLFEVKPDSARLAFLEKAVV